MVYAVDIQNVIGAHATVPGEQKPLSDALPEVHMNKGDGTATLTVPDQAAPRAWPSSARWTDRPGVKAG